MSFWPKQQTWCSSGYNVGYWSSDAEVFYQHRRRELSDWFFKGHRPAHVKVLRSAADWKKDLKRLKRHKPKTEQIVHSYEDMAIQVVKMIESRHL